MKLVGLIGGVSPESTVIYYRLLNEAANRRLGVDHSAKVLLYTLNYGVMIEHYNNRNWPDFIEEVVAGASRLANAGVEAIAICSNTTHVAADAVAETTGLPVIHLLDCLAHAMDGAAVKKPLLLGTPVVMGEDHYRNELAKRYGGDVVVPSEEDQAIIGDVILNELVQGVVLDRSRDRMLSLIARYEAQGVDGVILGCTELCMILSQEHLSLPLFDTTAIHAEAVSAFVFGDH